MTVLMISADGSARAMSPEEFTREAIDPVTDARLKSVKKDKTAPNIGDVVRLNDHGLEQIFGSAVGKSFMKRMELTITHVDDLSMTYPEPTFCVNVDDPEINQFLIDNACFDIVRRA